MKEERVGIRAILLGALVAAGFAWYSVRSENQPPWSILTATQIPVLPYLLIVVLAAGVNPLLRWLRIPFRLAKAEIMIVFVMGTVSSGLSTFGLASQVVPLIGALFNRDWNTQQERWDLYIEPYVNESFFISERGITAAARTARDAEFAWRRATETLQLARELEQTRAERASLLAEARPGAGQPEPPRRADADGARRHRQALAEAALRAAEARWAAQAEGLGTDEVLRTFDDRIEGLRATMAERSAALRALEAQAFARTADFRHGLPADLRAIPGLLPGADEPFEVYAARLGRMRRGMAAVRELHRAAAKLAASGGGAVPAAATDDLRRALDVLRPGAETADLLKRRDDLQAQRQRAEACLDKAYRARDALAAERRDADAAEFHRIDKALASSEKTIREAQADIQSLNDDLRRRVDTRLAMAAVSQNVVTQLESLVSAAAGPAAERPAPEDLQTELRGIMNAFSPMGISWRRFFAGDVPWGLWVRPLLRWGGIVFVTYLMLMTLNVLVFRQWAHHEQLIYPLAELPLLLGGYDAGPDGPDREGAAAGTPRLYRSAMFWCGAAVSSGVLGWNILAAKHIIPGIAPIGLVFPWDEYVRGSVFSGLAPNTQHQIFFTLIGIAFLIPARISFSMWSFHFVYMGIALCLVWLGHGVNLRSFPHDISLVFNFRTAMGGGAMVAFSSLILWKCRPYLVCAFRPRPLGGLSGAERAELRISSALFLGSSLALILLLTFGLGSNLFFSVFCYLILLLVTIGVVRAVAEGGLFAFQCWFNPFHVIRSVLGMDRPWTSASVLAPLAVYYYVMLWDIKAYIAPAMANALKIRDRTGIRRLRFHAAVLISMALAAVVAIATHIILAYHKGGDAMHGWFYQAALRDYLFGWIKSMAISNPVDTAGGQYWFLAGIIAMALLLFFRRRCFWLPHPLGMIVWVNPAMWCFWFSFFLGWSFKTLVSRYGNRGTYHFFRDFFIGLIIGELIMCLFGVDLNRNWG